MRCFRVCRRRSGRTAASSMPPNFNLGRPRRQRAAQHPVPGLPEHQRDQRHRDQPDEGRRPSHDQDGLLQHAQLQGAAARRLERHRQLRQRHQQPASTRSSATRTPRSASSARTSRPPQYVEGAVRLQQHRGLHPGQLEGERQADARLRRPARPPAAAVRLSAGRRRTSSWTSGRCRRRRRCTSPAARTACIPARGTNRQAMNPITGQFLGPNIAARHRHDSCPNTGNTTNGLFLSGQGIVETTYTWPLLALAPRFGMAYDLTGTPDVRAPRRRRPLLRPAERQLDLLAGAEPAGLQERHGPLRRAADAGHRRPDDRRRRPRSRSSSTRASCRRPRSGTRACR